MKANLHVYSVAFRNVEYKSIDKTINKAGTVF